MPKKPNYDFEKRKKELDRKQKQEEKRRRKRENAIRDDADAPPQAQHDDQPAAPPE